LSAKTIVMTRVAASSSHSVSASRSPGRATVSSPAGAKPPQRSAAASIRLAASSGG
jgi:hypothetical protein